MNDYDLAKFFEAIADYVLLLASLVKEPFVPGLVVFVLLVVLFVVTVLYLRWSNQHLRSVASVSSIITGGSKGVPEEDAEELCTNFYDRQPEISSSLEKLSLRRSAPSKRIAFAWSEYRETLKVDSDSKVMLNGIRPSVFFNTEDLDAEARGWKVVPGLFVSIGLAFTFFGLIAALQQTGDALTLPLVSDNSTSTLSGGPASALQKLLEIASAKFIMSLTGLVCSIIFAIVLRRRLGKIEHAIDSLCIDIEKRVGFIALESLAFDQKKLLEDQKEHFQTMNTELIAAIGDSLNKKLPKAISASIGEIMAPMMSQVGQVGMDGVRDIVGDLSSQLSGDVARAMGNAADRFDGAAQRIEQIAGVLRGNANDMSGDMKTVVADLSRTMTEMRDELSAGASATTKAFETGSSDVLERIDSSLKQFHNAVKDASEEQRDAAGSISTAAMVFAKQIDQAGQGASEQAGRNLDNLSIDVTNKLNEALRPMLAQAEKIASETNQQIVRPVRDLTSALEGFVSRIEQGTNRFGDLSNALANGTDAASRSVGIIDEASVSLRTAAEPIAILARGLSTSASATAQAATGIAGSLEDHRGIVKHSMDALSGSLAQFQSVIERYDDLDEKLGGAFVNFRSEVDTSIKRIGDHTRGVHDTYADALSQLQAVVDQVEDFRPVNRG